MTALVELVAPRSHNLLKSADLWARLKDEDPEVVAAWRRFGELLLAELRDRSAALDGKATSLVGWSAAVVVGAVSPVPAAGPSILAVVPAMVAALAAIMALRVSPTTVPSQMDWFCFEESVDAGRLERFYLLALRDWHECDAETARHKGAWLRVAQGALLAAAMVWLVQLVVAVLR